MPRPSRLRTSSPHPRVEAGQPGLAGGAILPVAGEPGERHANLDVASGMALLKEAFEQAAPEVRGKTGWTWRPDVPDMARRIARNHRRVAKTLIGLAVVVAVGWLPVRTLLQTTSIEAVINARLITLRAPIEGEIGAGLGATTVGMQLEPGAGLMKIVNRRAERGRLDDLHRLINRLESERQA